MRQMRSLGYSHPIVALTANAMIGIAEEFANEGFDGFISKPIQTKQLNATLTKHIKDKQSPEVIEAAKAGIATQPAPKGNIDSFQSDPVLLKKLMADFGRRHVNTFADICRTLESGDVQTAHRLAHTVKGAAGLLLKEKLMDVADAIEQSLAKQELPTRAQLAALEQELNAVLKEIGTVEDAPLHVAEGLKKEDALLLLDKVGSLLEGSNAACLDFIDELRKIPNSAELCREIEDFNFSVAQEILEKLRAELED
jgi:HPt (histidine-containing phosphotransfer) domain-containing protein